MGKPLTTTVSTKGQVILPKAVRDSRDWKPGVKLIVEETPEGVLLKPAPVFPPTRLEDVAGMLKAVGRGVTIDDMDAVVRRRAGRLDRDRH